MSSLLWILEFWLFQSTSFSLLLWCVFDPLISNQINHCRNWLTLNNVQAQTRPEAMISCKHGCYDYWQLSLFLTSFGEVLLASIVFQLVYFSCEQMGQLQDIFKMLYFKKTAVSTRFSSCSIHYVRTLKLYLSLKQQILRLIAGISRDLWKSLGPPFNFMILSIILGTHILQSGCTINGVSCC